MSRVTTKQVEGKFQQFVSVIGGRVATSHKDVGGYHLNYASIYGGYNIEKIHNEMGAINYPFGHTRQKASMFWDMLDFAIKARGIKK